MQQLDEGDIQALVKRIQQGETDLFGEIFDIFSDRVFRFIYLKVGDREIAKDITSETFLGAFQSIEGYKASSRAKFSTWLFSIAHKKVIDYYRLQKNRKNVGLDSVSHILEDKSDSDLEKVSKKQKHQLILKYLAKLPKNLREILILRLIEEFSYKEIKKITGLRFGNIRILVHRGINKLKEELTKDGYKI